MEKWNWMGRCGFGSRKYFLFKQKFSRSKLKRAFFFDLKCIYHKTYGSVWPQPGIRTLTNSNSDNLRVLWIFNSIISGGIIHGGIKIHKLAIQSEFHEKSRSTWKRKVVPVSEWIKPPAIENSISPPQFRIQFEIRKSFDLARKVHSH